MADGDLGGVCQNLTMAFGDEDTVRRVLKDRFASKAGGLGSVGALRPRPSAPRAVAALCGAPAAAPCTCAPDPLALQPRPPARARTARRCVPRSRRSAIHAWTVVPSLVVAMYLRQGMPSTSGEGPAVGEEADAGAAILPMPTLADVAASSSSNIPTECAGFLVPLASPHVLSRMRVPARPPLSGEANEIDLTATCLILQVTGSWQAMPEEAFDWSQSMLNMLLNAQVCHCNRCPIHWLAGVLVRRPGLSSLYRPLAVGAGGWARVAGAGVVVVWPWVSDRQWPDAGSGQRKRERRLQLGGWSACSCRGKPRATSGSPHAPVAAVLTPRTPPSRLLLHRVVPFHVLFRVSAVLCQLGIATARYTTDRYVPMRAMNLVQQPRGDAGGVEVWRHSSGKLIPLGRRPRPRARDERDGMGYAARVPQRLDGRQVNLAP